MVRTDFSVLFYWNEFQWQATVSFGAIFSLRHKKMKKIIDNFVFIIGVKFLFCPYLHHAAVSLK